MNRSKENNLLSGYKSVFNKFGKKFLISSNYTKNITFLICAAFLTLAAISQAQAQTLKADYQFQGSLNSSFTGAPAPAMTNLTGSGGVNSFQSDTIDGYTRQTVRFPFNSGLAVNTSGLIPNNAYTIVMLFKLDAVSGFRRGVDFANRTSDDGAYIENGRLEFENPPLTPFQPNTYVQIVIVRETSGRVRAYRDGGGKVDVPNDGGTFAITSANTLRFFQDDLVFPNEASAGNVARIRLYDAPMTEAQAQGLDRLPQLSANCTPIPISVGQSINGNLSLDSCSINGNPTDLYTFAGTQGQQIVISLDSAVNQLDRAALLQLITPGGQTEQNSGAANARIPGSGNAYTLPLTGTYTIRASSVFLLPRPEILSEFAPQNLGNYTLSLIGQPANTTCVYAPSPNVTNVSPTGGTYFFDVLAPVGCPTAPASVGAGGGYITIVSNTGGRVTFSVTSNTGTNDRTGTITVGGQTHTITQFGIAPPTNNAFAQAQTLSGETGTVNGRNTNATAEANEPIHAGNQASRSVWYRWTAPGSGLYSFTTSGSDFDTVMAIYTGTSVGGLSPVAENDNTTGFDLTSKINFQAAAGVVYYIAVDGKNGASGSVRLTYSPYRRLFRLYLQNFNGFASPIIPTSVTAKRADGAGDSFNGKPISLGVYEFDLPNDNLPYIVTISGPTGIRWNPPTYLIDNSAARFNELMEGEQGGGQNQTAKAEFESPVAFRGYIDGISQSEMALLSVKFASRTQNPNSANNGSNAEAPNECTKGLPDEGPNRIPNRVLYQCVIQPNTEHQVTPSAQNKSFTEAVLRLLPIIAPTGPSVSANFIIKASNAATYDIGGQVTANGQPLAGVVIDLAGVKTDQFQTLPDGAYSFKNLAPGNYKLTASRGGFIFEEKNIAVTNAGATVNFAAQTCSYSFSGSNNLGIGTGTYQFDVNPSNPACEWTARDDSDWITINAGSSVGKGKVQFTVLANNGAARQGTIRVGEESFIVTQANGCVFNVGNPTTTNFQTLGSAGSVAVTASNANCAIAAATDDYCMVSLSANAAGVNYTVSTNTGVARSAVITIAGQRFTISQTAAAGTHRTKFDFDGDGKADIAVYRPTAGAWYLLRSGGAGFLGVQLGQAGDIPVAADYDGDGKTDLAVYRPSNGTWYIFSEAAGYSEIRFGAAEDKPVPADYDGDGKADIAVYRPSTGSWYRLNSSTGEFVGVAFGIAQDKPVPADYDGDGLADIAVVRQSGGLSIWYILGSRDGFYGIQFGADTDKPVPADYDGDGRTDIAVYRPSTGAWYRLNSSTGQFLGISFGAAADIPAAADYNGDKRADIAVYRPSRGEWYIWSCTNNELFQGTQFGAATDKIPQAALAP